MENNILTQRQLVFLEKAGADSFLADNFYLTGGTALAAFYLQHRYSEDLDFFSEKEVDLMWLNIFFDRLKKDLAVKAIDFQQSYNRNLFFLHFNGGEVLKTEFTFFPFSRIEMGSWKHRVSIDSLTDIAVNKLFTIYQRSTARDYIDLYLICKEKGYAIEELIKQAKIKFDWHVDSLQLGTQFIKSQQAQDYPRMIKNIPAQEWQDFFVSEAKKLRDSIIS